MDLTNDSDYLHTSSFFSSHHAHGGPGNNDFSSNNPFLDPFVRSFPLPSNGVSQTRRNVEPPGRHVFSFRNGIFARKSFPSKWDDAEKWLVRGTSLESSKQQIDDEKLPQIVSTFQGPLLLDHHVSNKDINDKFPNEANPPSPKFGCSDSLQGFLFGEAVKKDISTEMAFEVKHRDIGTEITSFSTSTTFKTTSPARHNTPENRSGPLTLTNCDSSNAIDIAELQECHLAKLHLATQFDSLTSNWSSREEEEDDISKSLRHFEMNSEYRRSVSESKPCAWEEEEKTKRCLRYQREEARIQAWVNLQSAKAEAESRKLEVKIQKMRSNLEEKLMKRMADVYRKAEEWRAEAQFQHSEQIRKIEQQTRKVMSRNNYHFSGQKSCGCFPCNNHHI